MSAIVGSAGVEAIRIDFDSRVYALETLQKAALKLTRMASFDFSVGTEHSFEVFAVPCSGVEMDAAQFIALFRTEVLDQHLRAIVANETAAERNLILAYAFSNTKLLAP